MNFQDFTNEWVGRTVDFNHVFRFENIDLILQYLYECHQVAAHYTTPTDFLINPDQNLLAKFDKLDGSTIVAGDIVILRNPEHIVLATGNQNSVSFEALEQNGHTGDGSLQEGDAIRSRYIELSRIEGSFRVKPQQPVVEPEVVPEPIAEVPVVPPAPPSAPVPVPLNSTPLTLVTSVMGYSTKSEAEHDMNAKVSLAEGDYLLFRTAENGMQYIGLTRGGIKYWINPADNVVPEPEPVEEVPSNYVSPRASSVEPEVVEVPEVMETVVPDPDFSWKDSYVAFSEPRIYVVNQEGRAWNEDENQPQASVMLYFDQHINVYGWFIKDGQKYYRLKVKRDVSFDWWVAVPQTYNDRAVLTLPAPSFLDRLFHRHQQMKSIFTTNLKDGMKLIDNTKNPYKNKEKIK